MDSSSVFVLISVAAIILLLAGLAMYFNNSRHRRMEQLHDEQGKRIQLPMTFLQKRAWWGLIIGAVASVGILLGYRRF